jgi:hypothetical protein
LFAGVMLVILYPSKEKGTSLSHRQILLYTSFINASVVGE